jgi:hypothetical protein
LSKQPLNLNKNMKKTTKTTTWLVAAFTAASLQITAQAATILSRATAIEANLSASAPDTSAWFGNTQVFESYGPITAAEWNNGDTPGFRGASILQWSVDGLGAPGDTMGTVDSASFTIMGKSAGGNTYKVYRLTSAINGSTTWNTKPTLDLSSSVSFTMAENYALQTIDVSSLLANNGGLQTFGLAVLFDSGTGGENFWSTSYNNWPSFDSNNKLSASYSVIPEPSTYAMLLGGTGLLLMRRRLV